jgi:hypothetical protein
MELGNRGQLDKDQLRRAYVDTLIDAARQTEEEAMDSVYWERKFDLCARCRKELQADPLGSGSADLSDGSDRSD